MGKARNPVVFGLCSHRRSLGRSQHSASLGNLPGPRAAAQLQKRLPLRLDQRRLCLRLQLQRPQIQPGNYIARMHRITFNCAQFGDASAAVECQRDLSDINMP